MPISHRLSAPGIRFLDILSPLGIHLSYVRPTRQETLQDPNGISVFRVIETRPGWVPSLRRDGGVHTTGTVSPAATCRLSTANLPSDPPVLHPQRSA